METSKQQTGAPPRTAIIGAGLAGLAAARALHDVGADVTVFDKGRGPGGRISSRRAEPFAFDHGAQYFTARTPEFRRQVDDWVADGVVAPWTGRIVSLSAPQSASGIRPSSGQTERFVGTPRMSSLARHLADGLDVRTSYRVEALAHTASGWKLQLNGGGDLGPYGRLIITAPPAQAAALIGDQSPLGAKAAAISMEPCWAALLGLSAPYTASFDGAFCESEILSWVCRNSSKPGRPEREAWVLHATSSWTSAHMGADRRFVSQALVRELESLVGEALPQIDHEDLHFWRYARPALNLEPHTLSDPDAGLILAGDAYCGGRVEGAYLSGLAAARA